MKLPRSKLGRFAISLALLLVGFFVAWHFFLPALFVILLWLTDVMARIALAEYVIMIEPMTSGWSILTTISPLANPLKFENLALDPTKYTVGLPLLLALVLATPDSPRLRNLLVGTCVLLVAIGLMLINDILFQLLMLMGPRPIMVGPIREEYFLALPFSRTAATAIVLSKQISTIATPVLPIVLWAILNVSFLRKITGQAISGKYQNIPAGK